MTMSEKRKNAAPSSDDPLESKRLRTSSLCDSDDELDTSANPQSRIDPTYGQRSAFPGLDDLFDTSANPQSSIDPTYGQRSAFPGLDDLDANALFYGPASNGLEYLHMVRSEAKGVPTLLVAPRSPRVVATDQDSSYEQGYYADGAYTAVPDPAIRPNDDEDDEDPQEAYYASLCSRFSTLSATLQHAPPPSIAEPASPFHPSSPAQWRRCIFNTQPRMLLLNQLEHADVVAGLAELEILLSAANVQKRKHMGAWAWGLLAQCREVGQMGSEEVGVVRDLGKKARGILRGIMAGIEEDDEATAGDRQKDEGDELEPVHSIPTHSSDPLAAARQRLLDSLPPSSPDDTTLATLDMIVTIVGEFYRQRDLLDGRILWGETLPPP